jgi:hypothetical protein
MTYRRLIAITFILICVSAAWAILGTSVSARTTSGYQLLGEQVEDLWGSPHCQCAPTVVISSTGQNQLPIGLASSNIAVDLSLDYRRKGLLWYSTYGVDFDGLYNFVNPLQEEVTATVHFCFPSTNAIYDSFQFRVGDVHGTAQGNTDNGLDLAVRAPAGEEIEIQISYGSRGMDFWRYSFADELTTVNDFDLRVNTDFVEFDFPHYSISASDKVSTPEGWELRWQFESLVSDFDIGVVMPRRLNPGPVASRMSYFAPVSLLFFFTVLVVLGAVKENNLHPMHYFFLGASFFAFHLLFAYLVDHVMLGLAFVVSAVVSMALVITYVWRVVGRHFALWRAGLSQLLFLVLFSYAFFFEGYTGLVVTIGAIATLAVLMQVTAKVNWEEVFGREDLLPLRHR